MAPNDPSGSPGNAGGAPSPPDRPPSPGARTDPLIGKVFGRFRVEGKISQSGTGAMYKALQLNLDRVVALKILPADLPDGERASERFLQQAKAVSKLYHPNIVQVFAVGKEGDTPYIAREFVRGLSLDAILRVRTRLSESLALEILLGTAQGLAAAAQEGIIHGDVKPENIMITDTGLVKMTDFGLAKPMQIGGVAESTRRLSGTPAYLAPECCKGMEGDERSDIHSLGISLYQMVTGELPFSGQALPERILRHEPVPDPREKVPRLSEDMAELIACMTDVDPGARFQTHEELDEAARPLLEPSAREHGGYPLAFLVNSIAMAETVMPGQAPSPEAFAPVKKKRNPLRIGAAVSGVILVVGLLGFFLFGWEGGAPPSPEDGERKGSPVPGPETMDVPDTKREPKGPEPPDVDRELKEKVDELAARGEFSKGLALLDDARFDFRGKHDEAKVLTLRVAMVRRISGRYKAALSGIKTLLSAGEPDDAETWTGDLRREVNDFRDSNRDDFVLMKGGSVASELERLQDRRAEYEKQLSVLRRIEERLNLYRINKLRHHLDVLDQYIKAGGSLYVEKAKEIRKKLNKRLEIEVVKEDLALFRDSRDLAGAFVEEGRLQDAIAEYDRYLESSIEKIRVEAEEKVQELKIWLREKIAFEKTLRKVKNLRNSPRFADLEEAMSLLEEFLKASYRTVRDEALKRRKPIYNRSEEMKGKWRAEGFGVVYARNALVGSPDPRDQNRERTVSLKPFLLALHETTNGEYRKFMNETSHPSPPDWPGGKCPEDRLALPVTHVTPEDAMKYCEWYSRSLGAEVRLPTEDEWDVAAKWDKKSSRRWLYPYGEDFRFGDANLSGGRLANKEKFPVDTSAYGIHYLTGNAAEIVVRNGKEKGFAARGGSAGDGENQQHSARCDMSIRIAPNTRGKFLGFRVARSME